jgi:hypothetical protein
MQALFGLKLHFLISARKNFVAAAQPSASAIVMRLIMGG